MDFMALALLIIGIAAGFAAGVFRGRQLLAGAISRKDYDALLQDHSALEARLEDAAAEKRELTEYRERAIRAESLLKAEQQKQQQLRVEFENTANALLEKINTKFIDQSEKKLGDLLTPMQERLNDFKKLVTDSFTTQGKEQHTLKAEIEKIVLQTDSLTKALRGDVKAQGNWGEVMLERILEEAGLQRGIDYIAQATEMNLSDADGNRRKPDYIIRLPDKKHVVIDSKVSITAYDRYCEVTDETSRQMHLKEFQRSIKAHINNLEGKRYQDLDSLDTPEFVLMFMPIEGAYSLAIQHDRELHSYAWAKKVAIVCPTTLFVTLQTIASIWRKENQNKNAEAIAKRAGLLFDQLELFTRAMLDVGGSLKKAQGSYDAALSRLRDGNGLAWQVEKLKQLGAKTTKSLPKELLVEDGLASEEESI